MTPALCRAARSLIDMRQAQLADAASLGVSTVVDFERGRRVVSDHAVSCMRLALESAGVIFVAENGDGPGVRLRKPAQTAEQVALRIRALEAKVASIPETAEPSPEAGMNTMKKALAEAELVGLKHKRKRLRKPSRRDDPEGAK